MSPSAAANRGNPCVFALIIKPTLQHYSAFHCPFFRPHLKFSRIEILRGNVEEAVRLNVRELEALQVRLRVLSQEVHSHVLNDLAGC